MKKLNFFRMLVIVSLGFALTLSSNIQEPALMTHKVLSLAPGLPNTALGMVFSLTAHIRGLEDACHS